MNRNNDGRATLGRRHRAAVIGVALVVSSVGLTCCGVVNAARKIEHDVKGNKATIDTFTNQIKSSEGTTFEATYVTTGGAPATIVYAVQPPKGLTFVDTPAGSSTSTVDIIVNSSGEYSCTPAAEGSGPSVPKARQRRCRRREPDLRLLHAVTLDHVPEGLFAGGRHRR